MICDNVVIKNNHHKRNKYILVVILLVLVLMFLFINLFKLTKIDNSNDWYNDMLDSAIVSKGNNRRLKKVLEKAKNGEDVYIAAIGGSITECGDKVNFQDGYMYQFIEAFSLKYGINNGENIHFVNAGLSGTTSSLGTIRYKRDVIEELGHEPDILFIEYSVNDAEDEISRIAYESLIYDGLIGLEDAAVILIHSVVKSKWNMQDEYIPYGTYYHLPMISVLNAIEMPIKNGYLTDEEFFVDDYHPTVYGHTIMKDCLMNLMDIIDKSLLDDFIEIPKKPLNSRKFSQITMIDENTTDVLLNKGSFTDVDTKMQFFWKNNNLAFPNNWMKSNDIENNSFKLSLNCKTLLMDFKTQENELFGNVDIYVDGKYLTTFSGNKENSWCNSYVVQIIDGVKSEHHDIEIKMANGYEDKYFTIHAIGYNT